LKKFTRLFEALDSTTKSSRKIEILTEYLATTPEEDKIWCVALLLDKRPKRPVKTNLMKQWTAEIAGIPNWLFDESYHIVGDLGETIAMLVPQLYSGEDKPLHQWMNELNMLTKKSDDEKKQYVTHAWSNLDKSEKYIFNKLIGGSFRIGVSSQNVFRAIAAYRGFDQSKVAQALMGNWSPYSTTLNELLDDKLNVLDDSKPYPFYLAHQVEGDVANLGPIDDWQLEHKWDGIRGQIIVRKGKVYIWSRGEELMTDRFPELNSLNNFINSDIVLDGEILCHDGQKPLSFSLLQTRIARKVVSAKLQEQAPIKFMAYDILESNGEDIRSQPLSHRRVLLEKLVKDVSSPQLLLSSLVQVSSWNEALQERLRSRNQRSEGLMIKHKLSSYEAGRKKGKWWKWKVDAMTIDAVMIYAMQGHGRRATLFTDYTFAVWHDGVLVPFAKAYSGLTDAEINEVDQFVRKNTIEKFGPVRSVVPKLVFEIAFEGIQKSSRHKSGIALRFPRIHRWRKDKLASEANSKQDLIKILDLYGE